MNYTENFEGIKIDVQAVDVPVGVTLQNEIRALISRLKKHARKIDFVDVYLTHKEGKSTESKKVGIRFGIPGNDPYASEQGEDWMKLMKNVEEKLRKQLVKIKEMQH
ncbi:MAG: HPF/RaiA family ribosome-associated protein [Flavobacteriales bacterium]